MTADALFYLTDHKEKYRHADILGYQYRDFPQLFTGLDGFIELNEYDMGRAAAEQIVSRIRFPEQAQREIIIRNQYHSNLQPR